jgi:hypothetical protein
MRHSRLLIIPFLMLFIMACGLSNAVQQVETQLPGALTNAPTALGFVETAVASVVPTSSCTGTPSGAGLGLQLDVTRAVLEKTGQFTFTESTANGQPVSTATLASTAAGTFSAISSGFSAQFIGDVCNLAEIKMTIPRTDQQATVDQGIGVTTVLFSGILPPEVTLGLFTWLAQNYGNVTVGGQQQTTFGKFQFTLQRDQANMTLDVLPAQ